MCPLQVFQTSAMLEGLKDDLTPGAFWGADSMLVFWRDNVVAGAPMGMRFKRGADIGDLQGNLLVDVRKNNKDCVNDRR